MNDDDELLAVKAAELYYEGHQTQGEIAAVLHVTRWKVGRLLAQARASGMVRIEIVHPRARRIALEHELQNRFSLTAAVVVPGLGDSDSGALRERVAAAAAEYLTTMRPVPRLLGISWGRTLHDIALQLEPGWASGVDVVQINGGVSMNRRASSAATTATTLAQKGAGSALLLPSPAILERVETKRAIEADRTVAGVLGQAATADAYVYSAGPVEGSSILVESGYLTDDDLAELRRKGGTGDVLGRFVDANGLAVDPDLDERTIGLSLDQLRSATVAIAVIAGDSKHDICRVVVTSGLCSVLVTDETTARHLLDESV